VGPRNGDLRRHGGDLRRHGGGTAATRRRRGGDTAGRLLNHQITKSPHHHITKFRRPLP
jgi:hypothetical protein